MTDRKKLKRRIAKLRRIKGIIPELIDHSQYNGDHLYSTADQTRVEAEIRKLEKQLETV